MLRRLLLVACLAAVASPAAALTLRGDATLGEPSYGCPSTSFQCEAGIDLHLVYGGSFVAYVSLADDMSYALLSLEGMSPPTFARAGETQGSVVIYPGISSRAIIPIVVTPDGFEQDGPFSSMGVSAYAAEGFVFREDIELTNFGCSLEGGDDGANYSAHCTATIGPSNFTHIGGHNWVMSSEWDAVQVEEPVDEPAAGVLGLLGSFAVAALRTRRNRVTARA